MWIVFTAAIAAAVAAFLWMNKKLNQQPELFQGSLFEATRIRPRLYLGNFLSSMNKPELDRLNIKHIVSIGSPVRPFFQPDIGYLAIKMLDTWWQDIYSLLPLIHQYIDAALQSTERENGAVLVHCMEGVSRSSTVVASYLMYKEKLTASQALSEVKELRPQIKPNDGFLQQLSWFEQLLNPLSATGNKSLSDRLSNNLYSFATHIRVYPRFGKEHDFASVERGNGVVSALHDLGFWIYYSLGFYPRKKN